MLKKILALTALLFSLSSFAAVDVNKANAAELDGIKGIGPSLSGKILKERNKGNQFWKQGKGRDEHRAFEAAAK